MNRIIRIPVQVRSGIDQPAAGVDPFREDDEAQAERLPVTESLSRTAALVPEGAHDEAAPAPAVSRNVDQIEPAEGIDWRDRALRLQAEMDNYRKRQQRLAQDSVDAERERLLRGFLLVVDNLERALAVQPGDGRGLREGIQLTHQAALQLLRREGVEPVGAQGQPFDPRRHEAVTTVDHAWKGLPANSIAEVVEPGYRQGDRLLRPAKVVVAV
jgi:molecular chaperone GrpE